MTAITTPYLHFGFTLVEGPSNIQEFPEASSMAFKRGDLVKLSSGQIATFTTPADATATTKITGGIIGVAAADGANDTVNAYTPVHVISPEQVWKVHGIKNVAASGKATYDQGLSVKLAYTASNSYTVSNGGGTFKTPVAAWIANTTAAGVGHTSNATNEAMTTGVRIVGYPDRLGTVKGGELLVRFNEGARQRA